MYDRIAITGKEMPRAFHYSLGEIGGVDRFARVVMVPQTSKIDRYEIEAKAYEIDDNGNLEEGPHGMASATSRTTHVIDRSSLGDTTTLEPGWVRVVGDYDASSFIEDQIVEARPTEPGEPNQQVYVGETGIAYRWDTGIMESIRQAKLEEMVRILRQSQTGDTATSQVLSL